MSGLQKTNRNDGSILRRVLMMVAGAALLSTLLLSSSAPIALNAVEMDGDIVYSNGPGAATDWGSLFNASGTPVPPAGFVASAWADDQGGISPQLNPSDDLTTFTQGSSDVNDISQWSCVAKGNVTDKIDLLHAYSTVFVRPDNHILLYAGGERFAPNGDASLGFWLLHDTSVGCVDTGSGASFTGHHMDGDRLITTTFTNGGHEPKIVIYRWNGGADGSLGAPSNFDLDCSTATQGDACGTGNYNNAISTPWTTGVKSNGGPSIGNSLPANQFAEFAVDLTALGVPSTECFGGAMATTRSSQSATAALHDFALLGLRTCGSIKVVKNTDGGDGTFNFTSTSPSGSTGMPGSFSVTVPANSSNSVVFDPIAPNSGFSIAESSLSGWDLSSSSCSNGTPANFAVNFGQQTVCTFSNTKRGALKIVKKTVGADGTFTFNVSGTGYSQNGISITTSGLTGEQLVTGLKPGDYTVVEVTPLPAGWVADSLTSQSVHVNAGDPGAPVTFTNRATAHLKLVKEVKNDNGGTADKSAWTLSANDGPTPISGAGGTEADITVGTYTLSESEGPAGYKANAWSCTAGTLTDNSLKLTVGQNATCTIVNDDIAPQITLKKVVDNTGPDGALDPIGNPLGSAVNTDWTLTAKLGDTVVVSGQTGVQKDVNVGSYVLGESGPDGYTATNWSCPGFTVTGGNSISLGLGDKATCTVTNKVKPAVWTVIKNVINDNGGTRVANSFSFVTTYPNHADVGPIAIDGKYTDSPNDPLWSQKDVFVVASTGYTVREVDSQGHKIANNTVADGYRVTYSGCDNVPIALGQDAKCVITNDDEPAHLTLIKSVDNFGPNGEKDPLGNPLGSAVAADWTLAAKKGSTTVLSGTTGVNQNVGVGSYTMSESGGSSSYTASNWVCPGFTVTGGNTIALGLGDNATCTITNKVKPAVWTVIKHVINDNGGNRAANSFSFVTTYPNHADLGPVSIDGVCPEAPGNASCARKDVYVVAGSGYTVRELDSHGHPIAPNTVADGYLVTYDNCDNRGIALGEDANCVITNNDVPAHLTLIKNLVKTYNGAAAATDFTLTATAGSTTVLSGATGVNKDVNAGTYALGENGPSGYAGGPWTCLIGSNAAATGFSVSLAVGDNAVCTVTNHDLPGSITIIKKTDPANIAVSFPFSSPDLPGNTFSVASGGSKTFTGLSKKTYTIIEGTDAVWQLERIQCAGNKGAVSVNLGSHSVTIDLQLADDVRCTFWNTLPRMTGGGSVFPTPSMRVTHGFELYCSTATKKNGNNYANNLEINWSTTGSNGKTVENNFHLNTLTSAICNGNPTGTGGVGADPEMPNAPFNTYIGTGTGTLNNGKPDAYSASWTLVDNGEPGNNDTFALTIRDSKGVVVFFFDALKLNMGNQQAH